MKTIHQLSISCLARGAHGVNRRNSKIVILNLQPQYPSLPAGREDIYARPNQSKNVGRQYRTTLENSVNI